ncbi:phosphoadenosine phosphosulfate reductase, partial [Candidatus Parcubacteria bacterium]
EGKAYLPMFEFRNWLLEFSKDHKNRMFRPNGVPGRLTLEARKEIFNRLRQVERDTGLRLLSNDEVIEINKCWENKKYITPYS